MNDSPIRVYGWRKHGLNPPKTAFFACGHFIPRKATLKPLRVICCKRSVTMADGRNCPI